MLEGFCFLDVNVSLVLTHFASHKTPTPASLTPKGSVATEGLRKGVNSISSPTTFTSLEVSTHSPRPTSTALRPLYLLT